MDIYYLSPIGSNFAANAISGIFNNPEMSLFERGKEARIESLGQEKDAWRSLNVRFLSLKQAAIDIARESSWVLRDARVFSSAIAAEVEDGAEPGTYAIEVEQLAKYHQVASDAQANAYAALGLAGTVLVDGLEVEIAATDTLEDIKRWINIINNTTVTSDQQVPGFVSSGGTIQVNDKDIVIPAGTTLTGIRDLINQAAAVTGAEAAVSGNRLYLADTSPEPEAITVGDAAGQALDELGMLEGVNQLDQAYALDIEAAINDSKLIIYRNNTAETIKLRGDETIWQTLGFSDENNDLKNEDVLPQNARFTVNGEQYESDSNTVTDAIDKVSITLKDTTNYAINVIITEDRDTPRRAIEKFVEQYNFAMDELNRFLGEPGIFRGNQSVWEIRNTMLTDINDAVEGLAASLNEAKEAGLGTAVPDPTAIDDLNGLQSGENTDGGTMTVQESNESLMKLSRMGIIYDEDRGTLSIDYDTLNAALESEAARVQALFTHEADNLARRFREHMESLVDPATGQVSTQIRVADLLIEEIEKDGTAQAASEREFTARKLDYLMLLTIKNTMARQRGALVNSIF